MLRCYWRHTRDGPASDKDELRAVVACMLSSEEEVDAANRLAEEATQRDRPGMPVTTLTELARAGELLVRNPAAALEILTGGLGARIRPVGNAAKRSAHAGATEIALRRLGRSREALRYAVESVELATSYAGPESAMALDAARLHAALLADVGQVQEARTELQRVLAAETRVLGADNPATRQTEADLDHVFEMNA
mmetsp:Transcript_26067/g.104311  ORF Transcript_26067/g.104311 Transcript_26067/m.104311 type:complete len:195 (-) Transcript_26067:139-723(-)